MKFLLTLFLLGGLSLSNIHAEVIDSAGLFSKNAIETADKKIQEVQTKVNKTLVFETITSLDGKDSKDVSIEKARAKKVNGVYVLIAKKEKKIEIRTGSNTKKLFNDLDARTMKEKISSGFKSGNFDTGLLDGVNYFHSVFISASTTPNQPITPNNAYSDTTAVKRHHRSSGGGFSLIGILIFVVVVFLIFRLVGAVIGMFTRGGGGGYANQGYNNGYYGGNQGGGGMGFFGTFLTGMFGAMAGSWLYDKFTGNDSGLSANDYSSNDNDYYAGSSGSDSSWSSTDDYSDYSSGDSGSYDSGSSDSGGFDSGSSDSGGSDW